jgi:hypothetical protein
MIKSSFVKELWAVPAIQNRAGTLVHFERESNPARLEILVQNGFSRRFNE